jgi:hypothetical protein
MMPVVEWHHGLDKTLPPGLYTVIGDAGCGKTEQLKKVFVGQDCEFVDCCKLTSLDTFKKTAMVFATPSSGLLFHSIDSTAPQSVKRYAVFERFDRARWCRHAKQTDIKRVCAELAKQTKTVIILECRNSKIGEFSNKKTFTCPSSINHRRQSWIKSIASDVCWDGQIQTDCIDDLREKTQKMVCSDYKDSEKWGRLLFTATKTKEEGVHVDAILSKITPDNRATSIATATDLSNRGWVSLTRYKNPILNEITSHRNGPYPRFPNKYLPSQDLFSSGAAVVKPSK